MGTARDIASGRHWSNGGQERATYVAQPGELAPGAVRGKDLAVPLPRDLEQRLEAYCERTGMFKTHVTRLALERLLDSVERE